MGSLRNSCGIRERARPICPWHTQATPSSSSQPGDIYPTPVPGAGLPGKIRNYPCCLRHCGLVESSLWVRQDNDAERKDLLKRAQGHGQCAGHAPRAGQLWVLQNSTYQGMGHKTLVHPGHDSSGREAERGEEGQVGQDGNARMD